MSTTRTSDASVRDALIDLQDRAAADIRREWGFLAEAPAAVLRPADLAACDIPDVGDSAPLLRVDVAAVGVAELVGHLDADVRTPFTCTIDGRAVTFNDLSGLGPQREFASAAEWFGWIAGRRATAVTHSSAWDGDDVDTMLERVERDVVSFDRQATLVSTHPDAEALTVWIRRALGGCPLDVLVRAHSASALTAASQGLALEDRHWEVGQEATRTATGTALHHADGSLVSAGRDYAPALAVFTDGAQVTAHDSTAGVDPGALRALPVVAGTGDWYSVELAGVPSALLVPGDSVLDVENDGDGSRVWIRVGEADRRRRELADRARFDITWGAWLPDEAVVDPVVLATEITRAESDLDELAQEDLR